MIYNNGRFWSYAVFNFRWKGTGWCWSVIHFFSNFVHILVHFVRIRQKNICVFFLLYMHQDNRQKKHVCLFSSLLASIVQYNIHDENWIFFFTQTIRSSAVLCRNIQFSIYCRTVICIQKQNHTCISTDGFF